MVASAVEIIATERAKLNLEENTDDDDDLLASAIEADLEEAEAVIIEYEYTIATLSNHFVLP